MPLLVIDTDELCPNCGGYGTRDRRISDGTRQRCATCLGTGQGLVRLEEALRQLAEVEREAAAAALAEGGEETAPE